jgi:hypothetical protein
MATDHRGKPLHAGKRTDDEMHVGYTEIKLPNPANPNSPRFALMGVNTTHLPQHSGPFNYTPQADFTDY